MNNQNLFDAYTKLCYLQKNYTLVMTAASVVWSISVLKRGVVGNPVARAESPDLLTAICDAYDQLVPPTLRNCGGTESDCEDCDSRCADTRQPDRHGEDE